jgi:hypothetical protein
MKNVRGEIAPLCGRNALKGIDTIERQKWLRNARVRGLYKHVEGKVVVC